MEILIILNIIAIIVILTVSVINISISLITQYKVKEYQRSFNSLQSDINDTRQNINTFKKDITHIIKSKLEKHAMNILDLDEFNELDPYIKDIYKQQIVKTLMPALMNAINDQFFLENLDSKIQNNSEQINKIIKGISYEIKTKGLKSIPKIYNNISQT